MARIGINTAPAAATSTSKVKVSANDTTEGYLNGKLVIGTYTTLTENNDGGAETLTVDVDLAALETAITITESQISDLSHLSVGTDNQVPFSNATADDFDYSSKFTFDGNTLTVSPTGNNTSIVANGSGSGIGLDIDHSGSGTKLNIGNGGSGDFIVVDTNKLIMANDGDIFLRNDSQTLSWGAGDDFSIQWDGSAPLFTGIGTATVDAADKVVVQDTSDSDRVKTVTVQSIVDTFDYNVEGGAADTVYLASQVLDGGDAT